MANVTLQSFNVFLTERLTAAAVDIYGFVEKAVIDYQEEVYRTKLENQRLQRLLDLVYKPEIRLRRADSRQIGLSTPTQEVCVQEQQIKEECVPIEVHKEPVNPPVKEEPTEPWSRSTEAAAHSSHSSVTDDLTRLVTVGEHEENRMPDNVTRPATVVQAYEAPDNLTRVVTAGDHLEYTTPARDDHSLPYCETKTDMFYCHICRQSFLKKVDLKSHLAAHATESSPISAEIGNSCYVCGKRMSSKSHLVIHMRTHTGEKPFACGMCGNRYRVTSHLKEHLRTHTGERPYACYICGRGFNRGSNMSKHAWNKHGEIMAFKCTQCDQRFSLLQGLKRHMRTVHRLLYPV